jgi:integrase
MPVKLYRRGEIWHYRGTVAGRRLRGSTGTSDKTRAQRIAAEKEGRQWKGHLDGPASVLTFAQAALQYRAAGKSTTFLATVEDYWKDTPVLEITAGAIRRAAQTLYPSGRPATRNRKVIVPTQAIINHAARLELCPKISVERFKVVKREKEPVTWEWIQTFMAHANPHLGALACFMFLTGARVTEALSVTWEDVDLNAGKALIRQTKVGSERRAHLPAVLVAAIANIPDRTETVFKHKNRQNANHQWHATIARAGIKPLSFHSCRHGFATAMLQAGVDPVTTAKRGGWKSPAHVFSTYGHAMDDETVTERIIGTNLAHPTHRNTDKGKLSRA